MNDDLDDAIIDADATKLLASEKLITDAETLKPLLDLEREAEDEKESSP